MIYQMFAVKDKALDSFSAPFTQATIEAGLRMWRDLVLFGEENNRYRRSPEDFALYLVGTYDDETGHSTFKDITQISSAVEILADARNKGE